MIALVDLFDLFTLCCWDYNWLSPDLRWGFNSVHLEHDSINSVHLWALQISSIWWLHQSDRNDPLNKENMPLLSLVWSCFFFKRHHADRKFQNVEKKETRRLNSMFSSHFYEEGEKFLVILWNLSNSQRFLLVKFKATLSLKCISL